MELEGVTKIAPGLNDTLHILFAEPDTRLSLVQIESQTVLRQVALQNMDIVDILAMADDQFAYRSGSSVYTSDWKTSVLETNLELSHDFLSHANRLILSGNYIYAWDQAARQLPAIPRRDLSQKTELTWVNGSRFRDARME